MESQYIILPGIIEVRWIEARNLSPNMVAKHVAGLPVAVMTDTIPLKTCGVAQCESVEEHNNNGRVEKTTLTFMTNAPLPRLREVAWLFRQASGQWWLIGSREPHYPTVKITFHSGEPGGERAVNTVEITHQAVKSLIPVAL